ncbi:MAG TPA: trypsin-like peptidase domain-containing protein [Candidatus Paceibacterota bacterium]|nr:trypsin-like peptidase domain-containing protein [Candidatus Paceibacterota bacterium]
MFCDNCGARLEEGSEFCHSCGKPIAKNNVGGEEKSLKKNASTDLTKKAQIAKRFLSYNKTPLIAGVLILILGCFFIAHFYSTNNSSDTDLINQSSTFEQVSDASTTLNINSINPSVLVAPYQNIISISGTGFQSGTVVEAGTVNLQISGNVVSNLMYVKYPGNFSPGTYDITIQNPDGEKSVLKNALAVQTATVLSSNQNPSTELSAAQIVSNVSPSVVLIRTDLGCGSGMIVKSDGTILTDDHVINGAGYVNVYLNNGTMYTASVVSENTTEDLALLKIADNGLSIVTFGNSSDSSLPLGSPVTALGYPLTCNQDQTLEVDQGIVTARRTSDQLGTDVIQTSARINPGDSGGPLVDNYGNVVGINESILTIEDFDFNVTGIAFATPSEVITPFIDGISYSPPTVTNSSYSSPSPQPAPSDSHYFQFTVTGTCDDNGNGIVILNGYPYTDGYEIPPDDINTWADDEIDFTVPDSVTPGTYRVSFRGYEYEPVVGSIDCSGGGNITIQ